MEHRWGERLEVNMPVQVSCLHPRLKGSGLLVNVSMSGGLIALDFPVRNAVHDPNRDRSRAVV
jgi:hypothetical protein